MRWSIPETDCGNIHHSKGKKHAPQASPDIHPAFFAVAPHSLKR
jgi:hypothetical protein